MLEKFGSFPFKERQQTKGSLITLQRDWKRAKEQVSKGYPRWNLKKQFGQKSEIRAIMEERGLRPHLLHEIYKEEQRIGWINKSIWKAHSEVNLALQVLDSKPEFRSQLSEEGERVYTIYKRVADKILPVPTTLPDWMKIRREVPVDPMETHIPLPLFPPEFEYGGRLTEENLKVVKIGEQLWPEERKLALHVLKRNETALAFEAKHRGRFKEEYFDPYIIPTVPHVPWKEKQYPPPPALRQAYNDLIREKLEMGSYKVKPSAYCSRVFILPKGNGGFRTVHDMRKLNSVSIRDTGLPPHADSFAEQCAGCEVYTVMDLYWGYDGRSIAEESEEMTAFSTDLGLLVHKGLPVGHCNAVAEFQRCMTVVLREEIPHNANVFIDDVPILGPKTKYQDPVTGEYELAKNKGIRRYIWEHLVNLDRILWKVLCSGQVFSGKKTQLCVEEAHILGQICTSEGRLPQQKKVDKILGWPIPTKVKELRAFLGLCGQLRLWIPGYSGRVAPLTKNLHKGQPWTWTEEQEAAFQDIKEAVVNCNAMLPLDYQTRDPNRPIILGVDTSNIAIGITLSQDGTDGKRRYARYSSLPISGPQALYSQPKLEMYGLYRAVRHMAIYLAGVTNLVFEMDAKYVQSMLTSNDPFPETIVTRWRNIINVHKYTFRHVSATKFKINDALSRREPTPEELEEAKKEEAEMEEWVDKMFRAEESYENLVNQAQVVVGDFFYTPLTQEEKRLNALCYALREGDNWETQPGFHKYHGNIYKKGRQVIISRDKRRELMTKAHDELGHKGKWTIIETLNKRFWWPTLRKDVENHVRSCHKCQLRSTRKVVLPLEITTPATIFTQVSCDVMYMPKGGNKKYLVLARDNLSGWVEGRALTKLSAAAIANFLWQMVITRYGYIAKLTTDNGPEFKGAVEELTRRYGIPHIKISPYNSQANGQVERGHFAVREALLKACGQPTKWPEFVEHILFADRITVRRSTKCSPFRLIYGVDPILPFDLSETTLMISGYTTNMTTEDLLALRINQLAKRQEDITKVAEILANSRYQTKLRYEQEYKATMFKDTHKPGTLVIVRNKAIEQSLDRKHKDRYLGPYKVVRRVHPNGPYLLAELDDTEILGSVAANRLLQYHSREDNPLL